jgi:hypothetical protein
VQKREKCQSNRGLDAWIAVVESSRRMGRITLMLVHNDRTMPNSRRRVFAGEYVVTRLNDSGSRFTVDEFRMPT